MKMLEVLNSRMLANPVVVRELRQTVKGNIVTLAMNFILAILLIIVALTFAGNENISSGYTNSSLGRDLFGGLLIFLMIVIWGVMPLSVYFKFSKERDPDDPDLMFITNMSAGQILLGKYYAAATQIGLYFCSFLPFLLICYMFKGIDVLTMLRAVVQVLVFAGLVAQIAILLAAIPKRKFLLFTFAAAIAALAFFAMILFAEEILPSVYRTYRSRPDPLWAWYWLVVAIILSTYLFILTRAFIMPDTANRAPLPRMFLTVLIIAGYGVCWYISDILHGSNDPLIAWTMFTFMFCIAAMIFSISERDSLSVR
ncbi:MAG: hypothetical protein JXM68_01915, partial [Sedimentisphaerales bacterium]|nr:hypothetical protein [Sedimentisphaerales bacterium]